MYPCGVHRMPLFAIIVYSASKVALDGVVVDDGMVTLLFRAATLLAARDIIGADDESADDDVTVH